MDSSGSRQGQMTVMANFYKLKAVIFSRGTLLYVVSLLGLQLPYIYRLTCNAVAFLLAVKMYKVGSRNVRLCLS